MSGATGLKGQGREGCALPMGAGATACGRVLVAERVERAEAQMEVEEEMAVAVALAVEAMGWRRRRSVQSESASPSGCDSRWSGGGGSVRWPRLTVSAA